MPRCDVLTTKNVIFLPWCFSPSKNRNQPFCVFCVPDASCFGFFFFSFSNNNEVLLYFLHCRLAKFIVGFKIFINLQGLLGWKFGILIWNERKYFFKTLQASSKTYRFMRTTLKPPFYRKICCIRFYYSRFVHRFNFSPFPQFIHATLSSEGSN